jgi:hypothetical protein
MTSRTGELGTDPGRAGDRTALAWTRSALSLLAIAGLTLHASLVTDVHPLATAASGLLLIASIAVWRHGATTYGRRIGDDPPTAQPRAVKAMTGVTLAAAAVAMVLVART